MPLVFPFSPWFKWLLLLFYGPVDQPPRWDWSCSVPRNGGTHTGILRGIVEMLQDAKPLCEFECVRTTLLLGTLHHSTHPACACARVCVCVDRGTSGCWVQGRHNWQLAFGRQGRERERERGRKGVREEGEGVDEVSKDSCIAELYLLQSTIWK